MRSVHEVAEHGGEPHGPQGQQASGQGPQRLPVEYREDGRVPEPDVDHDARPHLGGNQRQEGLPRRGKKGGLRRAERQPVRNEGAGEE